MIRSRSLEFLRDLHKDEVYEEPEQDVGHEKNFIFTRDIEFRQEIIYFLVVDRFFDGDPSNNEGSNPELFDPERKDWGKYWGGDLIGIIDKLDYLKGMGVTAIWCTPLFEQVEYQVGAGRAAMHGYWTKDFKRLNPRYLAPGEDVSLFKHGSQKNVFDRLLDEIHKRSMKLILDIVCNHSNPPSSDGSQKGEIYDDGVLLADFNDDKKGFYHHYGTVTNWEDMWQVQNCELEGLATFNENCNEYRAYIKSAIKLWLDRGVDALRVDTVKHMPVWFWQEFNADIRAHKPEVFIFGEWIWNTPENPISTDFANHSGMTILDFALCLALRTGVAQGAGFGLVQDVLNKDGAYNGATELVTFLDNHDMPRFQTLNGDPSILKIAFIVLMCTRGIPCIYYGTEQCLHDDTNGGNDPYNRPMMTEFNTHSELYRISRLLSYARKKNTAIALGSQWPKVVTDNVYVFVRRYRTCRCFCAVNKGDEHVTLENIDTEFPDGQYQCLLTKRKFWIKNKILDILTLAPKEGIVMNFVGPSLESQAVVRVQVNGVPTQPNDVVVVIGNCPELGNWNIDDGVPLEYINSNTWFGEIPVEESAGKGIIYKYAIRREGHAPVRENIVCRRWVLPTEGDVKWRDTWKGESIMF